MFKSIILEIRPRLRSVNVFLALTAPKPNITRVTLNPESFEIHTDDGNEPCKVPVKDLKIVPDSLCCVNLAEDSLSFRFSTNDDNGTFNMELLTVSDSSAKSSTSSTFLDTSSEYVLCCKNCNQSLSEKLGFSRVLPLPSDNLGPSDWFCHGHSDLNLDPKAGDIFYSCSFFHVNKACIENTLGTKVLVCKRCLSWLGLVKNSVTYKFWFNTVGFHDGTILHVSKPLGDTFACVQGVLNSVLYDSTKVILECASGESQIDYLLIWILEKELSVSLIGDGTSQDCKVAKVLFKYQKEKSAVVTEWENDLNVTSVAISKPMMVEVLKHLHENKDLLPKNFSESVNFYISYLKMY